MLTANIIERLKSGDRQILEEIYKSNRTAFLNFARKLGFQESDALDAYQESIMVLWENVASAKITNLKSSVSTYLFAIGKNKLLRSRRQGLQVVYEANEVLQKKNLELDVNFLEEKETNRQKLLQKALKRMSGRCEEILRMFYIQGYDLDEIKEVFKFKNKASLRSQKSRCLKQLKEIIKQYD